MRIPILLLGALLAGAGATATEANVNAMLGGKVLERDDWGPLDVQGLLGIQADITPTGWPLAIAVNIMASSDWDRSTVTDVGTVDSYGGVTELQAGLAWLQPLPGRTTLYGAGGASFASATLAIWNDARERVDYGVGVGTWAHAGAFWTINHFNIGFGAGWSWVPMGLDDRRIDAGGWRFGILLGGNIR